jgi:hypothetical protein
VYASAAISIENSQPRLVWPNKGDNVISGIASLLLQQDANRVMAPLFGGTMLMVLLAMLVVVIVGMWKVFVKAGQPGWAILIPIYNLYILLQIAGRPGWWLLLYFIPVVNIAIAVIVAMDIAKSFGQSAAFGIVLLFLLSGIGYLILGFGNARYLGPAASVQVRAATAQP